MHSLVSFFHYNYHRQIFVMHAKFSQLSGASCDRSCLSAFISEYRVVQIICLIVWKVETVLTFCSFYYSTYRKNLRLSYLESLLQKLIGSGVRSPFPWGLIQKSELFVLFCF